MAEKGYHTLKEVNEGLTKKNEKKAPVELFDYNWLEDEEY